MRLQLVTCKGILHLSLAEQSRCLGFFNDGVLHVKKGGARAQTVAELSITHYAKIVRAYPLSPIAFHFMVWRCKWAPPQAAREAGRYKDLAQLHYVAVLNQQLWPLSFIEGSLGCDLVLIPDPVPR